VVAGEFESRHLVRDGGKTLLEPLVLLFVREDVKADEMVVAVADAVDFGPAKG
jgi:hypothetical protein